MKKLPFILIFLLISTICYSGNIIVYDASQGLYFGPYENISLMVATHDGDPEEILTGNDIVDGQGETYTEQLTSPAGGTDADNPLIFQNFDIDFSAGSGNAVHFKGQDYITLKRTKVKSASDGHGLVGRNNISIEFCTFDCRAQVGGSWDGVSGTNNLYIANSVVYKSTDTGIVTNGTGSEVYNTICLDNAAADLVGTVAAVTGNNNVFEDDFDILTNYTPGGNDVENISDPGFVDAANEDFKLKPTSIAVGNGTDLSLNWDIRGVPVPTHGDYESGAYEMWLGRDPGGLGMNMSMSMTLRAF